MPTPAISSVGSDRDRPREVVAVDQHNEQGGTSGPGSGSPTRTRCAPSKKVLALRRRLQDAPKRVRTLEERLLETKGQLAQAVAQNEKLTYTLREARPHQRPARGGRQAHRSALGLRHAARPERRRHRRRLLGGRKMRVAVHLRSTRTTWSGAARSCSTSRSTSSWPACRDQRRGVHGQGAAGGRPPGRSSSAAPTRSGWPSCPRRWPGSCAPATRC